ncbi:hypothetical protein [Methyloligella solikamskensis]|uniref:Terminase small subunit n=1 Tax=Methyloligella solikamskensis TaxID=1177756 RepID=A0ABW3JE31_9HYPH
MSNGLKTDLTKDEKTRPRRRRVSSISLTNRSRITNGSALCEYVDGRSSWARRFRDLIAAYSSDLGGDDALSEGQRAIIRRASLLQVELEFMEAKFAKTHDDGDLPHPGQIETYQRTAGALRRLIESVGLHEGRQARDVTPDPLSYARRHAEAEGEAA